MPIVACGVIYKHLHRPSFRFNSCDGISESGYIRQIAMHEAGTMRNPGLKRLNKIGSTGVVNVQESYSRSLEREVLDHGGPDTGCASSNQHHDIAQGWVLGKAFSHAHERIRQLCYRGRVLSRRRKATKKTSAKTGALELLFGLARYGHCGWCLSLKINLPNLPTNTPMAVPPKA